MQEQHDHLSGELEQKIKTLEKEYKDQIRDLNHAHEVEKRDLIVRLRAEISQVCSCACTSVDFLMII
jgi:excinuclease UvrABC helicase subunit UvrB